MKVSSIYDVVILTAAYYGHTLSDQVVEMHVQDLQGYALPDVARAYQAWRRDPRNRTFPTPAMIIAKIEPGTTDEDEAREIAARAVGAVKRFGWPNGRDAREYIGELGWQVIQTYGGWRSFCDLLHDRMIPQITAQIRDLAKSQIARTRAGLSDRPPGLPESFKRGEGLSLPGSKSNAPEEESSSVSEPIRKLVNSSMKTID